jgi:hypothetical protein
MTAWPAMMKRKTAAAYCDMSEAAFEREILAGRLPGGVTFGGREFGIDIYEWADDEDLRF